MTLQDALAFAGVMLIASIPFAVQPVTTKTLAAGIRTLSHHGAIVTRPAALEELAGAFTWADNSYSSKSSLELTISDQTHVWLYSAGLDMLCVGKTGILTLDKMVVQVFQVFSLNRVIPFRRLSS
jgi:magnesium-transporting ATPase (P-type)